MQIGLSPNRRSTDYLFRYGLIRLSLATCLIALMLLSGCDKPSAAKTTQVLARVNGDEITVYLVNRTLEQLPPSVTPAAQLQKQVLDTLIDQQLLIQAALAAKLNHSQVVIEADEFNHKQALVRAYLTQQFNQLAAPSDASIQAYFTAHPELFAARKLFKYQQFNVQADASQQTALLALLKRSSDLAHFLDDLKAQNLRFASLVTVKAAEDIPATLLPKLAAAQPGDALVVNRSDQGIIIIGLASSEPAPLSLSDARPIIQNTLLESARKQALQTVLKRARDSARIEYIHAQPGQDVRF